MKDETELLPTEIAIIGKAIVNAAFLVHKELGPGLLEKVYEVCMTHELKKAGFEVQRQVDTSAWYLVLAWSFASAAGSFGFWGGLGFCAGCRA